MNGLQVTTAWKNYFGNPKGSVLGVVNAAQSIGSFISLPFVGILSNKIGRRRTLLAGPITIVVASIIQAAAQNYAMFVIARVIVGVGSMLVVQPAPILITELLPSTSRKIHLPLLDMLLFRRHSRCMDYYVRNSEAPQHL
jgi:MFS family permease